MLIDLLGKFISNIAVDVTTLSNRIGVIDNLNTVNKSNLVNAINEIKAVPQNTISQAKIYYLTRAR